MIGTVWGRGYTIRDITRDNEKPPTPQIPSRAKTSASAPHTPEISIAAAFSAERAHGPLVEDDDFLRFLFKDALTDSGRKHC